MQEVREQILAEWTEPETAPPFTAIAKPAILFPAAGGLILIFILIGLFGHDSSFYFAAVVVLAAAAAIYVQSSRAMPRLPIRVGTGGVQVGSRFYGLDELAGFWLENAEEGISVNLELKRTALVPVSFLFDGSAAQCRTLFLEILPEVEPREHGPSDAVNKWIRLR